MSTQETKKKIERKMRDKLSATSVEVIDDSWKHAGHAQAGGGGHFTVFLVSEKFEGVSLLDRNRMVFDVLKEEMQGEIHALAVKAKTPKESGIS
ncbi:MAG: BolA family protein [Nitrospiria bacterium]